MNATKRRNKNDGVLRMLISFGATIAIPPMIYMYIVVVHLISQN